MAASNKAAVEAVAAGIGSLVALFATYPLKTIYTLQAIRMEERGKGRRLTADERRELVRSPARLLRALLPSLATLYSGCVPAAIETAASNAIYFYFYALLRARVVSHNRARRGLPAVAAGSAAARGEDVGVAASLAVAAAAGAINMIATSPAQVLTTQMQAMASLKRSLQNAGCAREASALRTDAAGVAARVWRDDGLLGFWRGLLPSLVLTVNPAVQYAAYEWLTQRHVALKARRAGAGAGVPGARRVKLSAGEVFLIGAAAKIAATVVTYPMIVVKSRLQAGAAPAPAASDGSSSSNSKAPPPAAAAAGAGAAAAAGAKATPPLSPPPPSSQQQQQPEAQQQQQQAGPRPYAGTWDVFCRIARDEGLGGFFAGMRAKLLQTALNTALMLMIKEQAYGGAAAAVAGVEALLAAVSDAGLAAAQ